MDRLRRSPRRVALAGVTAVFLTGIFVYALRTRTPGSRAIHVRMRAGNSGPVLHVPRVHTPMKIDGAVDDWGIAQAQTGVFSSVDGRNTPDSEAHLVWGDGKLYLLLYAADQDIRASVKTPDAPLWPEDAFRISFTRPGNALAYVLYVSPIGTLTDETVAGGRVDTSWQSGAVVAHDLDGTPDDPRDDDEEWIVEMALPLASLGLRGKRGEHIGMSIRRCDVPKGAGRRCSAWGERGGVIILE